MKNNTRLLFVLIMLACVIIMPMVACGESSNTNTRPTSTSSRPNKWDTPHVRKDNKDGTSDYTWQVGEGDTCNTKETNDGTVLTLDCTK